MPNKILDEHFALNQNKNHIFLLNKYTCWIILLVIELVHLLSFIFLFVIGALPLLRSKNEIEFLGCFSPLFTCIMCVAVASLHLYGFFSILFGGKSNAKKVEKNFRPQWYIRMFSAQGLFGRYGKLYEVKLALREVIEIPVATFQAYSISSSITNPWISLCFGGIIFLNCTTTPITLNSKNVVVRRFGTLILDGVYDCLFSIGFPALLIAENIYRLQTESTRSIYHNPILFTNLILSARKICITSLLDLVLKLIPFLFNFITLGFLANDIRSMLCGRSSKSSFSNLKSVQTMKEQNVGNPKVNYIRQKVKKLMSVVSVIWGTVVLVICSHGANPLTCPPGCNLQVYPWLVADCTCKVFNVNCKKYGLGEEKLNKLLQQNSLRDVFDLEISQCQLPNGPDVKIIGNFTKLYALKARFNEMRRWENFGNSLPSSLYVLDIRDSQLSEIPPFLINDLPVSLRYLYFAGINISTVPNAVVSTWKQLYGLELSNTLISSFPGEIFYFPQLHILELDHNRIAELPDLDYVNPSLSTIDLSQNLIKELPTNFLSRFPNLQVLYLDNLPLRSFPVDWNITFNISIRGTLLCDKLIMNNTKSTGAIEKRIMKDINGYCSPSCDSQCSLYDSFDSYCDLDCNTLSCKWDGGACKSYIGLTP